MRIHKANPLPSRHGERPHVHSSERLVPGRPPQPVAFPIKNASWILIVISLDSDTEPTTTTEIPQLSRLLELQYVTVVA